MQRSNENTNHEEEEPQKASKGGVWTGVLATGGLIAAGAGLALAFGPGFVPELGWIAKKLGRVGLDSGVIFGTGVVCTALSVVIGRVNTIGGQLRAAEDSMEIVTTLGIGMRHLVERMTRLHAELGELKQANSALMHMVKEQSETESSGMQVDATFRLAASVDQLDRKIEERLGAHDTTLESRFTDFDERMGELNTAFNGSQDQLRGLTATCCQLGEQLSSLEEATRRMTEANEKQLEASRRAPEPVATTTAPLELDSQPKLRTPDETEDEELEVSVELEDVDGDQDESEVPPPSSFDWDNVEVPDSVKSEGLGLLDEIEDEAPLTRAVGERSQLGFGGSSDRDSEDADGTDGDEGLGLLDALDDDGEPIPAEPGRRAEALPRVRAVPAPDRGEGGVPRRGLRGVRVLREEGRRAVATPHATRSRAEKRAAAHGRSPRHAARAGGSVLRGGSARATPARRPRPRLRP